MMMRLHILKAKQDRARHMERMALLNSLRPGTHVRPTQQDWLNAAKALGCPPENLLAVAKKESSGAGFSAEGRLRLLYEPHVAYRNSKAPRKAAKQAPDLFYAKWINPAKVPKSQPHIYRTSDSERWEILMRAADIDFDAALAGASYGVFQVLGENAVKLGFRDALHMVEHLYEGEQAHLEVFIRYLRRFNLVEPLRKSDWLAFARYNSPRLDMRKIYAADLQRIVGETKRMLA